MMMVMGLYSSRIHKIISVFTTVAEEQKAEAEGSNLLMSQTPDFTFDETTAAFGSRKKQLDGARLLVVWCAVAPDDEVFVPVAKTFGAILPHSDGEVPCFDAAFTCSGLDRKRSDLVYSGAIETNNLNLKIGGKQRLA
jgi:hypothetical protein